MVLSTSSPFYRWENWDSQRGWAAADCGFSTWSIPGACGNAVLTHPHPPECLAWPTCTLQADVVSPDSDMPKVGKGLEKAQSLDPRKAMLMVGLVTITIISSWLSCPCTFAHSPMCAPWGWHQHQGTHWDLPQPSPACPGHHCPCRTPLMPNLPLCLAGSWPLPSVHSSCPVLLFLFHLPSLLMELTYKSWKPKPP